MEDSDMKAIREIANGMEYVASEAVDKAPYDVTRNARITKVYYNEFWGEFAISGYDIKVDGKPYYIKKEYAKGITAKENDIVKLHIPCNNINNMYLSYAHDSSDSLEKSSFITGSGINSIRVATRSKYWSSGVIETESTKGSYLTFPATSKQFSSITVVVYGAYSTYTDRNYVVCADNGVIATMVNVSDDMILTIKLYNENPDTVNPVTKFVNVYWREIIIPNTNEN